MSSGGTASTRTPGAFPVGSELTRTLACLGSCQTSPGWAAVGCYATSQLSYETMGWARSSGGDLLEALSWDGSSLVGTAQGRRRDAVTRVPLTELSSRSWTAGPPLRSGV